MRPAPTPVDAANARRARYLTLARAIVVATFAALGAVSSRTGAGFAAAVLVCLAWLAATHLLGSRRPRPWLLPAIIAGDSAFVLAAIALSGGEASDLRFGLVALPAAWGLLYASRSVLVAAPASAVAIAAVLTTDGSLATGTALFLIAFAGAATLAFVNARESERAIAQVQTLERGRNVLLAQALTAEERERTRLAEVLHDDSLQYLLAVAQDLQELGPGDEEDLARTRETLATGLANLRLTLRAMHPLTAYSGDLPTQLRELSKEQERRGGFRAHLRVTSAAGGYADELVLSVVRELLTNAAKHARAENVIVNVEVDEQLRLLHVRVRDDGVGLPPERPHAARGEGHIGLALAEDRVKAGGGGWHTESAPDQGLDVRVVLPLPPA